MRVKRGFAGRRRHKRLLKIAEGFSGRKKNCFKLAKRSVQRALKYQYRDRKARKRNFRSLWIVRINAACRAAGVSYSRFVQGLKASGIELDRKSLAYLAVNQPDGFAKIVEHTKAKIAA